MSLQLRQIPKAELLDRLAEGHVSGITVVTPNQRLSQALQADFDRVQARTRSSWETADILPFGAFVARAWEDALHSELASSLPVLATPAQEHALWEEAIASSRVELFSPAGAASLCRDAWRLAHAWNIANALASQPGSEDTAAFLQWLARYQVLARERGVIDEARLAELVASLAGQPCLRKPRLLVLYGFDIVTPQQEGLLQSFAEQRVELARSCRASVPGLATRIEFDTADEELAAAARWARARLERNPAARIALVVPDLSSSRRRVERALARVLQPGYLMPAHRAASRPFDISLATPLEETPLVHAALGLLRLCGRQVPFEAASGLVRSPFIAGADAEMALRARLDAALRRRSGDALGLEALLRLCASGPRAPRWLDVLSDLSRHRKASLSGRKPANEWARAFSEALRLAGFPGERALDSAEHQALAKWHEVLAAFAALERVTKAMRFEDAIAKLSRLARETLFQPESPEVPIRVLGVLESAQLEFDHLWVLGLSDEAWPLPARPNPFIPLPLQRRAAIPRADSAASLELDRRITQGWIAAAGEVVLSHPRRNAQSELGPSPLIAGVAAGAIEALRIPAYATLPAAMLGTATLETFADGQAPALGPEAQTGGGTGVFKDQAACAFRAFARRRLHAEALEAPQPGLDARERGSLLHEMMHSVWKRLRTRAALEALDAAALAALLAESADEAMVNARRSQADGVASRSQSFEKAWLVRKSSAWLELERRRGDFEVVAMEEKKSLAFGGVAVNVKLDRMDRLAAGGFAVLDYKGGQARIGSWLGSRPDEPQLPMYALAQEDVRAVAFARLKADTMDFCGLAREENLLPGVGTVQSSRTADAKLYQDWNALLAGWRRELDALGEAYRAGDARVDPKRGACNQCEQHAFCRIAGRTTLASSENAEEAE